MGDNGKNAVAAIKNTSDKLGKKMSAFAHHNQIIKYNPLFPEQYKELYTHLPNLIQIVDDAVRSGIDVCKGAIGWTSKQKGVEVLHLYDEEIQNCGIDFLPLANCDSIYYVHPHNRHIYVNVDSFFATMHTEKVAELEQIAAALGAKEYFINITDSAKKASSVSREINFNEKTEKDTNEYSAKNEISSGYSTNAMTIAHAEFAETRAASLPELKWFANDNGIKNLIQQCYYKSNHLNTYNIKISSYSSSTMSVSTAITIHDAVSSMGAKCNFKQKNQEEQSHEMTFKLIF